jgi:hypothetical protein
MIVGRNGVGEFDGKAEPRTAVIRNAVLGVVPNFGPFAAVFIGRIAKRYDGELQRTRRRIDDILLEFELAGTLLEVLLVPKAGFACKFRAVEIVANWRLPGLLRGGGPESDAGEKG